MRPRVGAPGERDGAGRGAGRRAADVAAQGSAPTVAILEVGACAASGCLHLARLVVVVVLQLSLRSPSFSLPRRHSLRPAGERQPGSNAGVCGRPDGTRAPKPAPRGAVVRGGRAGRRPESEGSLGVPPSCSPGAGRGCMQGSGCASRGKPFPPRLTRWVRPGGLIRHFALVPGPAPAPRDVWPHLPPRWPEGR